MKAGMVAVPVNPKLPQARISDILDDSGAQLVFADEGLKVSLPKTRPVKDFYTSGNRSFETAVPDERQPGVDSVYVGLDRQAQGRCPLPPEPCLDGFCACGHHVPAR